MHKIAMIIMVCVCLFIWLIALLSKSAFPFGLAILVIPFSYLYAWIIKNESKNHIANVPHSQATYNEFYVDENQSSDINKDQNNSEILICPHCLGKIRIPYPPPDKIGICKICKEKFILSLKLDRRIKIEKYVGKKNDIDDYVMKYLLVLGVNQYANSSEIKVLRRFLWSWPRRAGFGLLSWLEIG